MMSIRGLRSTALTAACLAALPFTAAIADDTGTLAVSANVPKVCIIDSVGAMAFGDVNVSGNTDVSADIQWRCSKLSSTNILLNGGGAADVNAREMDLGGEKLGYQLFRDSSRTLNWGETDGVDAQPVIGQGMGAPSQQTTTIYGRVTPAQAQAAAEGINYQDSVTVTIVF
jgi:spore coat protein U-like protein